MKTILTACVLCIPVVTLASACVAGSADPTDLAPPNAATQTSIEAALRDVDVGHDVASAVLTLERALKEGTLTVDARDDAEIALAVAYRSLGEHERAVTTLEATMARHGRDDWARQQDASRLLVRWLTGAERVSNRGRAELTELPVASVAHALAKTFPRTSKQRADLTLITFGGDETSESIGTFRIGDAMRQEHRELCPLCDDDLSVHTSSHGYADWTSIPIEAERLEGALVVFYYDQETGTIPARYDAYLPLPSAAIEQRLSNGDGFYAVKQRLGAPAVVLFAAPRNAQLGAVERAFSTLTELPKEPVAVKVPRGLLAREIQSGVRTSFGAFRACYEALPEPRPAGSFELVFSIDGAGRIEHPGAGAGTTLSAPAFAACMLAGLSPITFPATGATQATTVRYPITFRPD